MGHLAIDLLVDVALVQVGGQGHEAHLTQPEVGELNQSEVSISIDVT